MKICVAAICKNEEMFIQRFLDHVKGADEICIVDTGSTDKTMFILQEWSEQNPEVKLNFMYDLEPRDLGRSRELAASVFSDSDLVVWLDIDEMFNAPDWVDLLRVQISDDIGGCWVTMNNGGSIYRQLKAYRKQNFHWKYRAHEVLIETQYGINVAAPVITIDNFSTDHTPDRSKPRNYLPELAADATLYPYDERAQFYYGRELCYAIINGDESVQLSEPEAVYRQLRALNAWDDYIVLMANELMCAQFMRDKVDQRVLNMPVALRPDRIESYGTAADIYLREGAVVRALSLAVDGIAAANEQYFLFKAESSNLTLCYEIAYKSAKALGMIEQAIYYRSLLAHYQGEPIEQALEETGLLDKVQTNGTESQETDPEAEDRQLNLKADAAVIDEGTGDQN